MIILQKNEMYYAIKPLLRHIDIDIIINNHLLEFSIYNNVL